MKQMFVAVAILAASTAAHAESFFQVEAGLGAAHVNDIGDGTWTQYGAPNNKEHLNTPVATVGFTGELYARGNWSTRYHVDYVYIGEYSSGCSCVDDSMYDAKKHMVLNPDAVHADFNAHGHLNGIAATLDAGYSAYGYRFAVEGGMWAYLQNWKGTAIVRGEPTIDFAHVPRVQYGYVVGARVERGPLSLSYRYYEVRQDWRTGIPGLAGGVHAVTMNYRF